MRKYVTLAAVILLTASSIAVGQPATGKWTFAGFNTILTRLTFQFPQNSPELAAVNASLASLRSLRAGFTDAYGRDADTEDTIVAKLSPQYSETMLEDIHALQTLPSNKAARLAVLQNVQSDLHDKASLHAPVVGIEHTFASTVNVHLSLAFSSPNHVQPATVNIHVNSCLRGTDDPGQTFGNGDTPFVVTRPPGCIVVWAEVGGQIATTPPVTRDIGQSGSADEYIQIPVQR